MFEGTVDFGGPLLASTPGERDIFVAKLARDGSHVWSKRFSNGNALPTVAGCLDGSGNVLLAGSFGGSISFGGPTITATNAPDVFVVKLDDAGSHVWSKKFGGADYEAAESISCDPSGHAYIAGIYYGSITFGGASLPTPASSGNAFLVKLTDSGSHSWSKGFVNNDDGEIGWSSQLAAGTTGNVIFAAIFHGTANLGGNTLDAGAGAGLALGSYSSSGAHLWSKGFGDAFGAGVRADGSDVYLIGQFSSTLNLGGTASLDTMGGDDAFVVKFQPNGAHTWSKQFGDAANQAANAVAVAESRDVLVGGQFAGSVDLGAGALSSAGGTDAYAVLLTQGGEHLWSARFGDAGQQSTRVVAASSDRLIVAGTFASTIDLGGGTLTSAGGDDIFVAAFTP